METEPILIIDYLLSTYTKIFRKTNISYHPIQTSRFEMDDLLCNIEMQRLALQPKIIILPLNRLLVMEVNSSRSRLLPIIRDDTTPTKLWRFIIEKLKTLNPFRSDPGRREKINLGFLFSHFFVVLQKVLWTHLTLMKAFNL